MNPESQQYASLAALVGYTSVPKFYSLATADIPYILFALVPRFLTPHSVVQPFLFAPGMILHWDPDWNMRADNSTRSCKGLGSAEDMAEEKWLC